MPETYPENLDHIKAKVITKLQAKGVELADGATASEVEQAIRAYKTRRLAEKLNLSPNASPDEVTVALLGVAAKSARAGNGIEKQVEDEVTKEFPEYYYFASNKENTPPLNRRAAA